MRPSHYEPEKPAIMMGVSHFNVDFGFMAIPRLPSFWFLGEDKKTPAEELFALKPLFTKIVIYSNKQYSYW